MAVKKSITLGKKELVDKEFKRLMEIFRDLEEEKLQTLYYLIQNAAYIAVCIVELQELIDENGYVDEYQNGENQKGFKQSEYVKMHLSYSKILETTMKELVKFVPAKKRTSARLAALKKNE